MSDQRRSFFNRFAKQAAIITGKPTTFVVAVIIIISWAFLGPFFGFSDTWQLVPSIKGARNQVMNLEELDEKPFDEVRRECLELAENADRHMDEKKS